MDLNFSKTEAIIQEYINRSARKAFELGNTCCNFCLQTFLFLYLLSQFMLANQRNTRKSIKTKVIPQDSLAVLGLGAKGSAISIYMPMTHVHIYQISLYKFGHLGMISHTIIPVMSRRKVIQKSHLRSPLESWLMWNPIKIFKQKTHKKHNLYHPKMAFKIHGVSWSSWVSPHQKITRTSPCWAVAKPTGSVRRCGRSRPHNGGRSRDGDRPFGADQAAIWSMGNRGVNHQQKGFSMGFEWEFMGAYGNLWEFMGIWWETNIFGKSPGNSSMRFPALKPPFLGSLINGG